MRFFWNVNIGENSKKKKKVRNKRYFEYYTLIFCHHKVEEKISNICFILLGFDIYIVLESRVKENLFFMKN